MLQFYTHIYRKLLESNFRFYEATITISPYISTDLHEIQSLILGMLSQLWEKYYKMGPTNSKSIGTKYHFASSEHCSDL